MRLGGKRTALLLTTLTSGTHNHTNPSKPATLSSTHRHTMIPSIRSGNFFQSIFTMCDNYVPSTCADSVHVDAISGTASVLFNDGNIYRYTNVSRRAIIKFIIDDAKSLGKFINNVLLTDRVRCEYRTTAPEYVLG